MTTIGVLALCFPLGLVVLPVVSALTRRRRINYRLNRTGVIVCAVLVPVGVLLIVTGLIG